MKSPPPSFFSRCRGQLRNWMDRCMDRRWGIDTLSFNWTMAAEVPALGDANHINSASYHLLARSLGHLDFKPHGVFYDIGCGTGRVLCFMARKRLAKVIGIELSREAAAVATANTSKLRGRVSPMEVRCGDAVTMDYTDGNLFFLANPFGAATLRAVLEKIRQSLATNDRPVTFLYLYPVHSEVFQASRWLAHAATRKDLLSSQPFEIWTYTPAPPPPRPRA